MAAFETIAQIDQPEIRQQFGKSERIEIRARRNCPPSSDVLPIIEEHTLFRQRQLCPEGAIGQDHIPLQNRIGPLPD